MKNGLFISELENVFESFIEGIVNYGGCSYKVSEWIDLYPEEVEDVTSSLRKYGVKAFTISAPLTAPRTTAVLDAFRNFGVVAKNIADINNCNGARIPILLMKVA